MRIYLHIGLDPQGATRLQQVLADKRDALLAQGILFPRSPGGRNHTRLFMAVTDPDHVDPLRFSRGYAPPAKQAALRREVTEGLAQEVAAQKPDVLILSAPQLGLSLHRGSELVRLRELLAPLSQDIRVVAHVDEQARMLTRQFAQQVMEGRATPLDREIDLTSGSDWWRSCLDAMPGIDPDGGVFEETQGAPFWLDFAALSAFWEKTFGIGSLTLRPYEPERIFGSGATREIQEIFDIEGDLGSVAPVSAPNQPSAAWLTRARLLNAVLIKVLTDRKRTIPRPLWRSFLDEVEIGGAPVQPGALSVVSDRFTDMNTTLTLSQPALSGRHLRPDAPVGDGWTESDPGFGYRATQYLLTFMYRIDKATKVERRLKAAAQAIETETPEPRTDPPPEPTALSASARAVMSPLAVEKFESLKGSRFAPHNKLGAVNEEELAAAYEPVPQRDPPRGSSGNVIVGCMKNEAPYIVEWVAYHRAVGVDNFLIYTNDCSDGTSEILDRLQAMGVLQHRNNNDWKGNSPQQHALNRALKEPVVKDAEWIIHIDVDEFVNVRTGNGTLQDFFARVPEATNIAMTWRLFGHNGVHAYRDAFVIDQFDTCAPKYCPKPHTVWGFKTMFRNIGAYEKISCHRPNKLIKGKRDDVRWVNGSGEDMTREAAEKGWRNSKKSIGYDLIQLNHYALRSAESFLIKRQRGRALHVDRSIGLNYWIRMDWSDYRDITIKRNLPRLKAEYDRLMQDGTLRDLHEKGVAWHHSKADELHATPEFEDLYNKALQVKLTGTERAAYALALDMES